MRDFFVFTMGTKTRQWRHIYHDIEIPRPKNHDIEKRRQISHDIMIPRRFFRGQKAAISRFQDHDIEISRPKSSVIEFLWNSNPYAP